MPNHVDQHDSGILVVSNKTTWPHGPQPSELNPRASLPLLERMPRKCGIVPRACFLVMGGGPSTALCDADILRGVQLASRADPTDRPQPHAPLLAADARCSYRGARQAGRGWRTASAPGAGSMVRRPHPDLGRQLSRLPLWNPSRQFGCMRGRGPGTGSCGYAASPCRAGRHDAVLVRARHEWPTMAAPALQRAVQILRARSAPIAAAQPTGAVALENSPWPTNVIDPLVLNR